jgi:hypothetical protein
MSLKVYRRLTAGLLVAGLATLKAPVVDWARETKQVLDRQEDRSDRESLHAEILASNRHEEPDPEHSTSSAQAARASQGPQGGPAVFPSWVRNAARMGAPSVIVDEPPRRRVMHVSLIEQSMRQGATPDVPEPEFPTGPVSPMGQRVLVATGMHLPPGVTVTKLPATARTVPQPQTVAGVEPHMQSRKA